MKQKDFEIQAAKNFFFGVGVDKDAEYMLNRLMILSDENPSLDEHEDIHTWDRHNYISFEILLRDILDLADQFQTVYEKGIASIKNK